MEAYKKYLNESFKVGDLVFIINKEDEYYNWRGIVQQVGTRKKKGTYVVKLDHPKIKSPVVSYNEDEIKKG